MQRLMEGRTVLVTGASRGIGAATARLLALHGARVVINYLENSEAAGDVLDDIVRAGGQAIAAQADVRDPEQVRAMVRGAVDLVGHIDTVVLNASIPFAVTPFSEYTWESFEEKLRGELGAAFHCCKALVPAMIQRGEGCIIAVSSVLSRRPGNGFCAHSTAKSGLDGFMRSLAHELGPRGIRVNVVAPGLTLTDATAWMPDDDKEEVARSTPLRRNATPEDVAGAVLLLASSEARFLNGIYLPVSGGALMS